jgi:hypothetical protein
MAESNLQGIFFFEIENKVTDVGLRLAIGQEVPDELEIRIDNLSSSKVRVFLKGNETAVKKFYSLLQTKKLGHAEKFTFSKIQPVTTVGCFSVNTDRFFHKLQCEQLGKFVDTGIEMQKDIKAMTKSIDKLTLAIDAFPVALAKALKESK